MMKEPTETTGSHVTQRKCRGTYQAQSRDLRSQRYGERQTIVGGLIIVPQVETQKRIMPGDIAAHGNSVAVPGAAPACLRHEQVIQQRIVHDAYDRPFPFHERNAHGK